MKKKSSLLLLFILFHSFVSFGQAFRFLPDSYTQRVTGPEIKLWATTHTGAYPMAKTMNDRWAYMSTPGSPWESLYRYKSVRDIIRVSVNKDIADLVPAYRYKVALEIKKYTTGGVLLTDNKVLFLSYHPDSLNLYNDLSVYSFTGYHAFEVSITGIYAELSPGVYSTSSISMSAIPANFVLQTEVQVQRYDLGDKYISPGSNAVLSERYLNVWGTLLAGSLAPAGAYTDYYTEVEHKPAFYELEWTYIEDYQYDKVSGTRSFKYPGTNTLTYDFRKNSTRIQLDKPFYNIPLVYEHGAIVFRFRMARPDNINYKNILYNAWTLPDNGSLSVSGSGFKGYGYIISKPHTSDSVNWQYTINFAEQGKYKHVINYFDGALKDRQTQTSLNSDDGSVVAVEKVYDYEGRPALVSLPVPVKQQNLYLRKDILVNGKTNKPYSAPDFDVLPGCSKPDSISRLAATSMAHIYYSALNPDKTQMQQFVPDAEGFPMVQTIYSPDNTNKVAFQGGAGLGQQLWRGHGTQYEYVRANQQEMDRLLGTEAGYDRYYPKQIVTDPNGQSSYSILNSSGKVVLSALQGAAPSGADFPIDPLDNLVPASLVCADLLKSTAQEKLADGLQAASSLYNDGAGGNTLSYSVLTKPFPTACAGQYLWAAGTYEVRVTDDCGNPYAALSTTGTVGAAAVTPTAGTGKSYAVTSPVRSYNLPKGKVLVDKKLSFSAYDIYNQVRGFVATNEGKLLCYRPEPYFIRNAVEASLFPCPPQSTVPAESNSPCDLLRKQMMEELYPGAKYGQYVKNGDGLFKDQADNSVFSLVVQDIPLAATGGSVTEQYVYDNGPTEPCSVTGCSVTASACSADEPGCGCMEGAHSYTSPCCNDCLIRGCKCIVFKVKKVGTARVKEELRTVPCRITSLLAVEKINETSQWEIGISNIRTHNNMEEGICPIFVRRLYYTTSGTCDCGNTHVVNRSTFRKYEYGAGMAPSCFGVGDGMVCILNEDVNYPKDNCERLVNVPDGIDYDYVPGVKVMYRYQADCVSFPAEKWHKGKKYTNIAGLSPQELIEIFDEEIAAALLPLHPEYCKLKNCTLYAGDFENTFTKLETFRQAEAAGMFRLNDIVAKDPMSNLLAESAINLDALKYTPTTREQIGPSSYVYPRLYGNWMMDKLAIANVYCGAGNDAEMLSCAATKYNAEINGASFVFINDELKQKYFETLQAYYLANRNFVRQFLIDYLNSRNNCVPCPAFRMTLTGSPLISGIDKFSMYDEGYSADEPDFSDLEEWKKLLYRKAMLGQPLGSVPAEITAEYNNGKEKLFNIEIDAVLDALRNCGFIPVMEGDIHDELMARLINGEKLSPLLIKQVITPYLAMMGKGLNDLCHPFLVTYGLLPEERQLKSSSSGFKCEDPVLYSHMKAFLNSPEIRSVIAGAMAPSGSMPPSSATYNSTRSAFTPPANLFVEKIMDFLDFPSPAVPAVYALPVSAVIKPVIATCSTGTCQKYIELKFYNQGVIPSRETIIAINTQDQVVSPDLQDFINTHTGVTFNSLVCINEEPAAGNYGLITQKTAVLSTGCPTCPAPVKFYVWTTDIDLMTSVPAAASLQNMLTCVDIKKAISDFNAADKLAYAYSDAANHPLFQQTLNSYLNVKFNKNYAFQDYIDLMEGCAVTDKVELKRETATARLEFSSDAAANSFETTMNTLGKYRPALFRYKDGSSANPVILVDLAPVERDELLRYRQYMSGLTLFSVPPLTGVISYTPHYTAAGSLLFINPSCSFSAPSSAVSSLNSGALVYERGNYRPYNLYTLQATAATPLGKTALIAQVNNTLKGVSSSDECRTGYAFWTSEILRSADYSSNTKQEYLDLIYGLPETMSREQVMAAIDPASAFAYTGKTASYDDPYCKGLRRSLYLYTTPVAEPGYNLLKNTILPGVVGTLGTAGAIPFPAAAMTVKSPVLSVFRKANGDYWYRYFDADDRIRNVYLTPPEKGLGRDPQDFTVSAVEMGPLPETFFITVSAAAKTVGGISLPALSGIRCSGYTDFVLSSQNLRADNVVLDRSAGGVHCYDSIDCESDVLAEAVLNGKAAYYQYFDSTVKHISSDMMAHLLSTSKDTLIYCGRQQQYQQTLYFYDQAGNLTRTVPPAGVVPLTDPVVLGNVSLWRDNPALWYAGLPVTCPGCPTVFRAESQTAHKKVSAYRYNSLNQLVYQKTPDGGAVYFFYDAAGRQIFSQNSEQRRKGLYAYNLYDEQGRPSESGLVTLGCPATEGADDFSNTCPFIPRGETVAVPAAHPDFITYSYDEHSYSYADLAGFIKAKGRLEVVRTIYDTMTEDLGAISTEMLSTQENLRSRVAAIRYYKELSPDWYYITNPYKDAVFSTYYSYDLSGNVKTITYDFPQIRAYEQRFKRVDYDYDLVSGKVNMISYNRGHPDQFYQLYEYDADNRITKVNTSNDGLIWNADASYQYYRHGPLARLKLGNQRVQSLEYAYTIQGWLKAINGDVLNPAKDMGKNGESGDMVYARDVIAHSLRYFDKDYTPIGSTAVVSLTAAGSKNLYNGNITQQTTGIGGLGTMQRTYQYDQLQRLRLATNGKADDYALTVSATPSNLYRSSYTYDLDGNIKTLTRFDGQASPAKIDEFTYTYQGADNNKLLKVADAGVVIPAANDLQPGQPDNNYSYDKTGNLVRDKQAAEHIFWDRFGKVIAINDTFSKRYINFAYDGRGNRIWKNVIKPIPGARDEHESEYYVRDAGGNILSTYRMHSRYDRAMIFGEMTKVSTTGSGIVLRDALRTLSHAAYPSALMNVMNTAHTAWVNTYTNKPVSFFMAADPTLKSNLIYSGDAWIDALRSANSVVYRNALLNAGMQPQEMFLSAMNYTTESSKLLELYSKNMSPFVCEPIWQLAQASYSAGNAATIYGSLTSTATTGTGSVLYNALATLSNTAYPAVLMSQINSTHASWVTTYTNKPASVYMSIDPGLKSNLLFSGDAWIDALRAANPVVYRDALLYSGMEVQPIFLSALNYPPEGTKLLEHYSIQMPQSVCQPIWQMGQAQYMPGNHAANASMLYNNINMNPQLKSMVTDQLINGLLQNQGQQMPQAGNFYTAFINDNMLWQSQALRTQSGVLTATIRNVVNNFGHSPSVEDFFDGWNGSAAAIADCTPPGYKLNTLYGQSPALVQDAMSREATRPEIATILTSLAELSTVGFGNKLISAGATAQLVYNAFPTGSSGNPATYTANATALQSKLNASPQLKPQVAGQLATKLVQNRAQSLPESSSFYTALVADNTLWQSAALRGQSGAWTTSIRSIINNYGDVPAFTAFFDTWSGRTAALNACTTPGYRLSAVYGHNPATALDDMNMEASPAEIATILTALPEVSTVEFGMRLVDAGAPAERVQNSLYMGSSGDTIKLSEHHIYGSSRLGVQRYDSTASPYIAGQSWFLGNILNPATGTERRTLLLKVPWYSYDFADLIDSVKKEPYGTAGNTYMGDWATSRTLGRRYYELTDHLGNVLATVLDRKTGSGTRTVEGVTLYDHWSADLASVTDYYPGGMMMPGRSKEHAWSRMGAQGSPKDDDIYGKGNFIDMGDRHLDTRIIRTPKTDDKAAKYASISPYAYVTNSFPNAKDPDGNVVLFINGQHDGTGGKASYWGGYDQNAMNQMGDHTARYIDGALGGWTNTATNTSMGAMQGVAIARIGAQRIPYVGALIVAGQTLLELKNKSNINSENRIDAGKAQGYKDAASIIANLSEGETIKVVTHSMGTGYARGYVQGVIDYANGRPGLAEKLKFVYELDINSFQGKDLPALTDIVKQTDFKLGGKDGGHPPGVNSVPTVGKIPGAIDRTLPEDGNKGHEVNQMSYRNIPAIGGTGTETKKPMEQGNNNENY